MSTLGFGFAKTFVDPNLDYLLDRSDVFFLVLYVYDLILIESSEKPIAWCKAEWAREFEMKDIGLMHYLLGLVVWQGTSEGLLG